MTPGEITKIIVALVPFLGSALIAGLVSAFISLRISERRIQIENITQERAKWRENIRKSAREVAEAWAKDKDK